MTREFDNETSDFPWHLGVCDAHCHPTDTMSSIPSIANMRTEALVIMSTRAEDQSLVSHCARMFSSNVDDETKGRLKSRVIPSFGWHPWFAHLLFDNNSEVQTEPLTRTAKVKHYKSVLQPQAVDEDFISSLADPTPLSGFISQTRDYLKEHPLAIVGEVGLDRSFRLPAAWTLEEKEKRDCSLTVGGREGRPLTKYKVGIEHQQKIFFAQLQLAAEMRRPVSVHSVSAHGTLYETIKETWKGFENGRKSLEENQFNTIDSPVHENDNSASRGCKPYPPRICLHSYSGDPQMIQQYLHPSVPVDMFFSFSMTINFLNSSLKTEAAIRAVPDNRILVESDLHMAGEPMEERLELVTRKVCEIKEWPLKYGVYLLHQNWDRFIFGET